jgi:predicted DsbA family dithiol-disulfide isomerase
MVRVSEEFSDVLDRLAEDNGIDRTEATRVLARRIQEKSRRKDGSLSWAIV